MIRFKDESELRLGEFYAGTVAGRLVFDIHNFQMDEANLWAYHQGSHNGRPCEVRLATIACFHLNGLEDPDRIGAAVITLVRYTSTSY